jgi:hypothetical protein
MCRAAAAEKKDPAMTTPDRRTLRHRAAALTAGLSLAPSIAAAGAGDPTAPAASASPADLQSRLLECLGGPWPEPCELRPEVTRTEQRDGYRLEWIRYEAEPGDRVPAILIVPDGASQQSPVPGIAVWHQHAGQWHLGKSEPAGLAGDPMHHTGLALAKQGYVVLCPDALCFEDRQDPDGKLQGGDFERYEFLREEARAGIATIARAYAAAGASDQFTWYIEPGTDHVLSAAMWERVLATFRRHL